MSGIKKHAAFPTPHLRDVSLVTLSEAASSSPPWGLVQVQQRLQRVLGDVKCLLGKHCPPPSLSFLHSLPITVEHQDGRIAALGYTRAHIPSYEEVLSGFGFEERSGSCRGRLEKATQLHGELGGLGSSQT